MHALGDSRPVVLGGGGHQVEHAAQALQRGGEVVEVGVLFARVVEFEVEREALDHGGLGDLVDGVDGFGGLHLAQRLAGRVGDGAEALRGEVVDRSLVARHPDRGRGEGTEGGDRVDIGVGDRVEGRCFAHGGVGHGSTLAARPGIWDGSRWVSGAAARSVKAPLPVGWVWR